MPFVAAPDAPHKDGRTYACPYRLSPEDRAPLPRRPFRKKDEDTFGRTDGRRR